MKELIWEDEAKETLNQILGIWPRIIRPNWKEKIEKSCIRIALVNDKTRITKELVIEAAEDALPKSYEPPLMRVRNPEAFRQKMLSQEKPDLENPDIKVYRWEQNDFKVEKPEKAPKDIKVCAIVGSPRRGGTTDALIEELLKGAHSAGAKGEKIFLHGRKISPCTGCMSCKMKELSSICVIRDEMEEIFHKILEADCIIIGSPIYTGRETAQTATFFDRLDALRMSPHFKKLPTGKRGALVLSWGWPNTKAYTHVAEFLLMLMHLFKIDPVEVIAACGFWGAYYAKGTVEKDKAGMAEAYKAGISLVTGERV